jgi:two-component system response regulator EvgA
MTPSVLIVDDHPTFRLTARLLLESEGYEILGEAEDGLSGLRKARELRPELVLLDINLPDTDGLDVAARLSSDEDAPMIVLISSRDPEDFGPLIARSGARGFIPKEELSAERLRALTG